MSNSKTTKTFRLTEKTMTQLNSISNYHGLSSATSALEYAVNLEARRVNEKKRRRGYITVEVYNDGEWGDYNTYWANNETPQEIISELRDQGDYLPDNPSHVRTRDADDIFEYEQMSFEIVAEDQDTAIGLVDGIPAKWNKSEPFKWDWNGWKVHDGTQVDLDGQESWLWIDHNWEMMEEEMDYLEIWKEKNDAGEGFAVGEEADDINGLEGIGKQITFAGSDSDVAAYESEDGTITIVGDANGPWAVTA